MDAALVTPVSEARLGWHYPAHYPWFLLLACLDVLLTWIVLGLGGTEANLLAARVIEAAGLPGMVLLKVAAVGVVLLICERLAMLRPDCGRRLASLAIAVNACAVTCGLAFLADYTAGLLGA
jgi:hypothetical protein